MQVQEVQCHLLQMLQDDYPELMYSAALGCLADLQEVILSCCSMPASPLLAFRHQTQPAKELYRTSKKSV